MIDFRAGDRVIVNQPGYALHGRRGVVRERRTRLAIGNDTIGPVYGVDVRQGQATCGLWLTASWLKKNEPCTQK